MKKTLGVILLWGVTCACFDPHAQESRIVQEIEAVGSGNLDAVTIPGLAQFFAHHEALATQVNHECVPLREKANTHWIETAEGKACFAAQRFAAQPHYTSDTRGY